jgi:glycosyltransferase involved in cell wall biosynthesis/Flp pilus assembly protein TadD
MSLKVKAGPVLGRIGARRPEILDRVTGLRDQADGARDSGHFAEAARLYDLYLAAAPEDAAILVQSGHMHKESGEYLEAEARYLRALDLMPQDADLNLQIGHLNKVAGRLPDALSWYKKAATLAPDWAVALEEIRHTQLMMDGQAPPVGCPPTLSPVADLWHQADRARDGGRFAEAAKLYDLCIEAEPNDASLLIQSGHMHKESGQYSVAEARYLRALRLTPQDADLNLQLGHFNKVAGRLSEALSWYEKSAALSPDWPVALEEIRVVQLMMAEAAGLHTKSQQDLWFKIQGTDVRMLLAELREIEPAVGAFNDIATWIAAPADNRVHVVQRQIRERLPANNYGTVICVPWIRAGGADLVATNLAAALRSLRPEQRVLILRTDNPQFERPDWIPRDVDTIDVSDLLGSLPQSDSLRLLYTVLVGLAPQRVVNANSLACWKMFVAFGSRLAERTSLHAYLFCWDLTPTGHRVGYPSEFYPTVAPRLTTTLTDTMLLKRELEKLYAPPAELRERLMVLPSPLMGPLEVPTAAERGVASRGTRTRPLILWAARLDRQKRFDLLVDVARLMPEVDFQSWGEALLDSAPGLHDLPPNLSMMGAMRWIAELPIGDSDGWLYTSAWEGMPTAIIELARFGMPVVASAVGGIPELIDDSTGWPVPGNADASAYVGAIKSLLAQPQERIARSRRLQERVARDHSAGRHTALLEALLKREELQ